MRNVITTTAFLLENFKTNIIIKEVDKESVFKNEALPILEDIVDVNIWENFNFIHGKGCYTNLICYEFSLECWIFLRLLEKVKERRDTIKKR